MSSVCLRAGCDEPVFLDDKEYCTRHDPYGSFTFLCDFGQCQENKQDGSRWCPEHHRIYGITVEAPDLEDQPDHDVTDDMLRAAARIPDAAALLARAASLGYIQPTSQYAGGVA